MCHPSPTLALYTKTQDTTVMHTPVLLQTKQSCWLKCAFLAVWSGRHNLWTVDHKCPWILQFL